MGLLLGLWGGLSRAGMHDPVSFMGAHGIYMVLGFLGTLIALERAVAIRRGWAYTAPLLCVAAVAWTALGLPVVGAGLLFALAGLVVVAVFAVTLAAHWERHLLLMAAGAVAWVVAAALWAQGWAPTRLSPMLAAFLVLTIVGERLELSRLRMPSVAAQRRLLGAAGLFGVGVAIGPWAWSAGLVVAGAGLLAQTAWLARNDIARVTIHRRGLARFAAACLLAGYVWLGVGGLLWIAVGLDVGPALLWDAALHAVFLGFVISMVMGHAAIILPAVLRTPLPHHGSAWVPLGVLHASVALRVGADLASSTWMRGWASHGNVTAILLFVLVAGLAVRRARRSSVPDWGQTGT